MHEASPDPGRYLAKPRPYGPSPPTTMALRKLSLSRFEKLTAESEHERAKLLGGYSPGYVAAKLGISRQAVHKAIHRGDLDAIIVNGDDGHLRAFLVPDESIERFAAARAARQAR